MYYTVYQITNKISGRSYIGMHQTTNLDDDYMGSGTILRRHYKKYGTDNFEKEILHIFDTKEEMANKEAELVNEDWVNDPNTYNLKMGGEGGWDHSRGRVTVRDTDGNCFNVNIDDPRYVSGELVHPTKGTTTVIDENGNRFRVGVDDEKFLKGEYVGQTKGYKHTQEAKNKISAAAMGNRSFTGRTHSDETKIKMSESSKGSQAGDKNSQYGKPRSEDTKKKISEKMKGIKVIKVICPHCSKEGYAGGMYRWHFSNCKEK